ncbi:MAG: ABC transporter permease subunit [Anaerolineae bacterium]
MNWNAILTIAQKDLREVLQNKMAWQPALIVPLIFVVVLPLLMIVGPQVIRIPEDELSQEMGDLDTMLANMPPEMHAQVDGLEGLQIWVVLLAGFMFAPMFLIIPIMLASVVGAESFVGERERKTLEALLYTPVTDRELFLGKVLASVIPAIAITLLSFIAYAIVVNLSALPIMGRIWFPLPTWYPLILWVAPAVATMGMAASVLVSSRVTTFMEAYQTSGMLILPVIVLMIGQIAGVVYLSVGFAVGLGIVLWLIDAGLIYFGIKQFRRAELIAKL